MFLKHHQIYHSPSLAFRAIHNIAYLAYLRYFPPSSTHFSLIPHFMFATLIPSAIHLFSSFRSHISPLRHPCRKMDYSPSFQYSSASSFMKPLTSPIHTDRSGEGIWKRFPTTVPRSTERRGRRDERRLSTVQDSLLRAREQWWAVGGLAQQLPAQLWDTPLYTGGMMDGV